jgi:hypothetical protein
MKKFFSKKISFVLGIAVVIFFGYLAIYLMSVVFAKVQ